MLLLLLWVPSQLLWLGAAPFHTKGEPREALAARDILVHGRWILPRRNGVELPSKPPGFHWLVALAALGRGRLDEAAARLPSAVGSIVAVLVLYVVLARPLGPAAALAAAAMTLTSFEWMRSATGARVDMTLTLGLTLSYAGGLLAWGGRCPALARSLFHGGMVWGALAKGPIGIALPATHAVLLAALFRDASFLRRLALWRGLAAVLLLTGGWYVLAAIDGGAAFVRRQVLEENVFRLLGGVLATMRQTIEWLDRMLPYHGTAPASVGHRHGVLYLAAALLAGTLPWTFFLPAALAAASGRGRGGDGTPVAFAAAWVALVFSIYAIAASKRSVYLLGLYPALFTLVACGLESRARCARLWRCTAAVVTAAAASAALLLALLALVMGAWAAGFAQERWIADLAGSAADAARPVAAALGARSASIAGGATAGALLAGAGALAIHARRWAWSVGLLATCTCLLGATTRAAILPAVAQAGARGPFAAAVRRVAGPGQQVFFFRHFDYAYVWEWGNDVPVYDGPLDRGAPRLLLIDEKLWGRLPAGVRDIYEPVPLANRPARVRLMLVQRVASAQER